MYCLDDLVTFKLEEMISRLDSKNATHSRKKLRSYMERNSHERDKWHRVGREPYKDKWYIFSFSLRAVSYLNNSLTISSAMMFVRASIAQWWWIIDFWIFNIFSFSSSTKPVNKNKYNSFVNLFSVLSFSRKKKNDTTKKQNESKTQEEWKKATSHCILMFRWRNISINTIKFITRWKKKKKSQKHVLLFLFLISFWERNKQKRQKTCFFCLLFWLFSGDNFLFFILDLLLGFITRTH